MRRASLELSIDLTDGTGKKQAGRPAMEWMYIFCPFAACGMRTDDGFVTESAFRKRLRVLSSAWCSRLPPRGDRSTVAHSECPKNLNPKP